MLAPTYFANRARDGSGNTSSRFADHETHELPLAAAWAMVAGMDEETGRRVCELIAGVMCSDDTMSSEERSFLKRVMQKCGLETDTALMPTYGGDVAEELAQLPEGIREEMLDLVILAAVADGQMVPSERAIIDTVARELGVGADDVVERIRKALPAS